MEKEEIGLVDFSLIEETNSFLQVPSLEVRGNTFNWTRRFHKINSKMCRPQWLFRMWEFLEGISFSKGKDPIGLANRLQVRLLRKWLWL